MEHLPTKQFLIDIVTQASIYFYDVINDFSEYFLVIFAAWIAHKFFLKQFLLQRKAERTSQVMIQKDALSKEIFDQITKKIDDGYISLGSFHSYTTLFKDYSSEKLSLFNLHFINFNERYFDLHDKLFFLSLTFERYDSIIDDYSEDRKSLSAALKKISGLFSTSETLKAFMQEASEAKIREELNSYSESLKNICSEINLLLQELSNKQKTTLRKVVSSLEENIELFSSTSN